ncbi:MAG TPA: pyruvate, water dikinase regulatory protein [Burkholderiaceae bacterium]|nr:pyruvate, water dikinase regulatory protein [Burkholderiaceae bacterium]
MFPDASIPSRYDRTAFFVSDGTGITAETFGHAVLAQFELRFREIRMPFVDSPDKAWEVVQRINQTAEQDGRRPLVFSTLVDPETSIVLKHANAIVHDLINTFVQSLEHELEAKSTHSIGRSHVADTEAYRARIDAINFSLAHDDGQSDRNLEEADVILVGISRCGKTPTSLYLAMTYGLKVANYPLIPEDFERNTLPTALPPYRGKLFGLSIAPTRLAEVRNERRPGSKYASLEQCRYEVNEAESLMRREGIRWLSSTTKSIEEIATTILQETRLERKSF